MFNDSYREFISLPSAGKGLLRRNDCPPLYKEESTRSSMVAESGPFRWPSSLVTAEYLAAAFDEIETKCGTIENYLVEGLSIDATAHEALREFCLAPSPVPAPALTLRRRTEAIVHPQDKQGER